MTVRRHIQSLAGLIFALAVVVGCDREPTDPFEAYLWHFEQKTERLFDHLANADEIVRDEAMATGDSFLVTEEVEVYRYIYIPSAAQEVLAHLSDPPRALILALEDEPADPEWIARFEASVADAQRTLAERIERFKATMPADPPVPEQDGPVGDLFIGACGPGQIYSGSDACNLGKYAYDDEGALFFYIQHDRRLHQLMIEHVLEVDVQEWVRLAEAASRFDEIWYCDNISEDTETGEREYWFANLTIAPAEGEERSWYLRQRFGWDWSPGFGGDASIDGGRLTLSGEDGYEAEYEYRADLLSEGQLIRTSTRGTVTSMSSCCPRQHCAEIEECEVAADLPLCVKPGSDVDVW